MVETRRIGKLERVVGADRRRAETLRSRTVDL